MKIRGLMLAIPGEHTLDMYVRGTFCHRSACAADKAVQLSAGPLVGAKVYHQPDRLCVQSPAQHQGSATRNVGWCR